MQSRFLEAGQEHSRMELCSGEGGLIVILCERNVWIFSLKILYRPTGHPRVALFLMYQKCLLPSFCILFNSLSLYSATEAFPSRAV